MGRPPGDDFSPSRGWLVSGQHVGRAGALRLLTTSLPRVTGPSLVVSPDPPFRGLVTHPWEVKCPTLRGHMTHLERSQQFYRVPAHLFGEIEVLPATQRTARFPLGNTAQKQTQPRTDTVRRRDLWTRGLGGEFSRELSKGQVPSVAPVSYTHLTLPTIQHWCRSRWSPYH